MFRTLRELNRLKPLMKRANIAVCSFYLCLIFLIWLTEFALKGQRLASSR